MIQRALKQDSSKASEEQSKILSNQFKDMHKQFSALNLQANSSTTSHSSPTLMVSVNLSLPNPAPPTCLKAADNKILKTDF